MVYQLCNTLLIVLSIQIFLWCEKNDFSVYIAAEFVFVPNYSSLQVHDDFSKSKLSRLFNICLSRLNTITLGEKSSC